MIKRRCPTAPHLPGMKRKTENIDMRVEPQLVDKIDAWRARQRVPPSRSAAIVTCLRNFSRATLRKTAVGCTDRETPSISIPNEPVARSM
jgi:hypothetical protein